MHRVATIDERFLQMLVLLLPKATVRKKEGHKPLRQQASRKL